jgi:hypothetical protein
MSAGASFLSSFRCFWAFFLNKVLKFTKYCKSTIYFQEMLFRCRHVVIMQISNLTSQCSLLMSLHILRSVRMTTHEQWTIAICARDYWRTLDLANAFLSQGVKSREELEPSPRAYPFWYLRDSTIKSKQDSKIWLKSYFRGR